MIEFNNVVVSNFKGYGKRETSLKLDKNNTTLILGDNEDVGEQGSSRNGAGKTSILESVVFALYGKGLDKNKPDDMVNFKNGKKMYVKLDFTVKGKKCSIMRGRKPSVLEFTIDKKSFTRDSMKNTDEEIMNVINIPYEVFMSVFFLNPFKESFMGMTSADQRNFVEKLLSLDTLAKRAEDLKAYRKELSVDLKLKNKDYENAIETNKRITRYKDSLKEKEQKFEDDRKKEIEECKQVLEESSDINLGDISLKALALEELMNAPQPNVDDDIKEIEENKKKYAHMLSDIEEAEESIEGWEANRKEKIKKYVDELDNLPSIAEINLRDELKEELQQIEDKLFRTETGLNTISKERKKVIAKQDDLESEFSMLDSGKCPYCKQRHTDETRIQEIAEEFKELDDQLEKLEKTEEQYNEEIKTLTEEKEATKKRIPTTDATVRDITELENRIRSLEEEVNPHTLVLEKVSNKYSKEDIRNFVYQANISLNHLLEDKMELDEEKERRDKDIQDLKEYCVSAVGTYKKSEIDYLIRQLEMINEQIQKAEERENPYMDQLKELETMEDVDAIQKELETMNEKDRHIGYLVKLLTDPKSFIRKNIVDQFLPYLNKKMLGYTTYLQLPHVAEIGSDMTVNIEYMGKDVSYFTLSRGERLRLDAACALALRDLMAMLGKSTNMMLVDEYVDSSIDDYGVRMMMNLLTSNCPNLFLISHREQFETLVDEVMVVRKRNGFSFLE